MDLPSVGISTESRKIPKHLSMKPGMTRSVILSLPAVYAIALGGVAMGSMKEKEEAMVAVTMRKRGCRPIERQTSASNGKKMVAVALLDVNSVTMLTIIATAGVIRKYGIASRKSKCDAIHSDNPLSRMPSARANPANTNKLLLPA